MSITKLLIFPVICVLVVVHDDFTLPQLLVICWNKQQWKQSRT